MRNLLTGLANRSHKGSPVPCVPSLRIEVMRALRTLRDNPLVILGIGVAAFLAWVVSDSTPSVAPPQVTAPRVLPQSATIEADMMLPTPPRPAGPSVVTAEHMPRLKEGMSRTEVEAIIGPPPANMVSPVSENEGRMTYKAAYLANLDPGPAPVRGPIPVSRMAPPPTPPSVPKSLIAVEYDATKPGHPLVKVQVQTPTF